MQNVCALCLVWHKIFPTFNLNQPENGNKIVQLPSKKKKPRTPQEHMV